MFPGSLRFRRLAFFLSVVAGIAAILYGCGTNSGSGSGSGSNPTPVEITSPASLASAQMNAAYSATLTATGGTTPYTWSLISGTLPMGLSFNTSTGTISGTATQAVTNLSLTFKVTDSSTPTPLTQTATLMLTVLNGSNPPPLQITSPASLPNAQLSAAYSTTLAATGGTTPYTWSLTSGTLPMGLSFNGTAGTISGTPTQTATNIALTFKVTDSTIPTALMQSATLSLTVLGSNPPPLQITSPSSLPNAQLNSAYSTTLTATGGKTPYTWALTSGTLPTGLLLNASTGAISGAPTQAVNNLSLTFRVMDSTTPTALTQSATLTLTVVNSSNSLQITSPSTLPTAQLNAAYSTILTATGGKTPYTWARTSGTLPTGLSFNTATGTISGTPTQLVTNTPLTFKVTDSTTPTALTQSMNVTLTVANVGVTLSPKRGGVVAGQQLTITASVTNDVGAAGASWSVSSGGALSNQTTTTASFSAASHGVYTITATSIADNTKSASVTIGVTDLAGNFTYHSDLSRDGSNPSEYALTTSNVTTATFGKLFSCTADGAIYTQPLWVANLTVNGVKRDVVFVATQHDTLYAFDADVSPCVTLWHVSLIDQAHGGNTGETPVPGGTSGLVGSGYGDITPEIGVTGTPVIDPSTNRLYVVSKSVDSLGSTFYQRLHAINTSTGAEVTGSPVTVTGTYPGTFEGGSTTNFNPRSQNQRPALALANGNVYIAWSSHEDNTTQPYYGWVAAYNASTLAPTATLNVTPTAGFAGIWMAGSAPAVDSSNNLYFLTGNGTFDPTNHDYGDSLLKVTSGLQVSQYFTPSDQASDQASDDDFGSGGAAILVDQLSSTTPHLVVGGGKDGTLYILNRDTLGGLGDGNAVQPVNINAAIYSTGAFWNGRFYIAGVGGPLQSYTLNPATSLFDLGTVPHSSSVYGFPGTTPSVSSSGTTNGIVWALDNTNYCTPGAPTCGPTVLHAYDATNVATELWNSTQGSGNAAGNAVKFTVPTVVNGKVYVSTRGNNTGGSGSSTSAAGELDVYGLLPN